MALMDAQRLDKSLLNITAVGDVVHLKASQGTFINLNEPVTITIPAPLNNTQGMVWKFHY